MERDVESKKGEYGEGAGPLYLTDFRHRLDHPLYQPLSLIFYPLYFSFVLHITLVSYLNDNLFENVNMKKN